MPSDSARSNSGDPAPQHVSVYDQLEDIRKSLAANLITEAEAATMKQRIIDGPPVHKHIQQVVHDGSNTGDLARYFRDAELRTHQVWRRDYEKFCTVRDDWAAMSIEEKQEIFLNKAKAGLINNTETMLSIYLLYGNDDDLNFLRSLLVNSTGSLRLLMHNLYVSSQREPSFLKSYGDRIVALSEPLFPPTKEFSALNTVLLMDDPAGGGPPKKQSEHVDPLGGGTHLPVQSTPDGHHYVDMSVVEQVVGDIQRQIASKAAPQKRWPKRNYNNNNYNGRAQGQANYNPTYNAQGYPQQQNSNYYNNNNQQNSNYQGNQQQNPNYQSNQQAQHQQHPTSYHTNSQGKGNYKGAGEPLPQIPQQTPPTTTTRRM